MHSHQVQVQQPGFFSNMWQGFGLGAGQSIAFNMFRNDPKPVVVTAPPSGPAAATSPLPPPADRIRRSKEYVQCMEEARQDEDACKHLLDQH